MRYGLDVSIVGTYGDPRLLADLAAEAERAGWDGFFIWDVIFSDDPPKPVADPWIALAAIATATHRIPIGALVTPLARQNPWQVARQTLSLDHLSRGRLIFGVGLGDQARDFVAFGEEADPRLRADKLDEGLDVLTGLWSGESMNYQGNHFQVHDATFLPKPLQTPRIPVWVAGYWPNRRPFRRAARWDGVLPGKMNNEELTPEELTEIIAYIGDHRDRREPFDVAVYGQTPADPDQVMQMIKPWIAAGATWWREGIEDARGSLDAMRERIRRGPPRIS
ncbi:MAG: LLM class flavin-dependent oxidoreductase [Thermomicrobiales bacterium]